MYWLTWLQWQISRLMPFEMAKVGVWVQGWPQTHGFLSWMKTAAAGAADPGISSGRYGSWGFKWWLGKVVTTVMTVAVAESAPWALCAQAEGRKVARWLGTWCIRLVRGMWCIQEQGGLNWVAGLVGMDCGCELCVRQLWCWVVVVAVCHGGGAQDGGVEMVAVHLCLGSKSGRAQSVVGGGKGSACQNGRWRCSRWM